MRGGTVSLDKQEQRIVTVLMLWNYAAQLSSSNSADLWQLFDYVHGTSFILHIEAWAWRASADNLDSLRDTKLSGGTAADLILCTEQSYKSYVCNCCALRQTLAIFALSSALGVSAFRLAACFAQNCAEEASCHSLQPFAVLFEKRQRYMSSCCRTSC